MKQSIQRFLEIKKTEEYQLDEDKFEDFPVQFKNEFGELETGFIQDAEQSTSSEGLVHNLEVVLLCKRRTGDRIVSIKKTCIAPPDCALDWDAVHCAYDIV